MPLRRTHPQSAASRIRQHIETKGECFWKVKDFADFPATAAAQTLSRLTHEGVLQRVGKGIYYHPRMTVLGPSRPSQSALLTHRLKQPLLPAGITAANLLGFSTQNPARPEYATTASSIGALAFGKEPMRVYTRRPETWKHLCPEDAALLDFLRGRGAHQRAIGQGYPSAPIASSAKSRAFHAPGASCAPGTCARAGHAWGYGSGTGDAFCTPFFIAGQPEPALPV